MLTDHLGLTELQSRPDYATREMRKTNRLQLKTELEVVLKTRSAAVWSDELNAIGVPSGPVLGVPDILSMPQVAERGFLQNFPDVPGVGRDINVVTTGVKVDGNALTVDAPPPELGQDNETIWSSLGLSQDEITALRKDGVL